MSVYLDYMDSKTKSHPKYEAYSDPDCDCCVKCICLPCWLAFCIRKKTFAKDCEPIFVKPYEEETWVQPFKKTDLKH